MCVCFSRKSQSLKWLDRQIIAFYNFSYNKDKDILMTPKIKINKSAGNKDRDILF